MITVLTPTRGRPAAARQLDLAFHATAVLPDTRLMLIIDDDDPELPCYTKTRYESGTCLATGPRRRLGPTLNHWTDLLVHGPEQLIIGFMGDDHRPRTPGWDEEIARAETAPGVTYGNDLLQGQRLATAAFITGDLVRRLGYMAPPGQVHLYLDDFWMLLGGVTRLTYLPEVVIEHLHPVAGKAPWDAGYAEVNSLAQDQADHAAFDHFVCHRWPVDRERLTC